jgi:hypothetical protein
MEKYREDVFGIKEDTLPGAPTPGSQVYVLFIDRARMIEELLDTVPLEHKADGNVC